MSAGLLSDSSCRAGRSGVVAVRAPAQPTSFIRQRGMVNPAYAYAAVAERILPVLSNCLSTSSPTRVAAEADLRRLEREPFFFIALASVVNAGPEAVPDHRLRLLAAQVAKNKVPTLWRPSRYAHTASTITDGEREDVHDLLLAALSIDIGVIAIQVSEWIARIARKDYPDNWGSLLTELVHRLGAPEVCVRVNALTTLDLVFEQLSRRRLLADRKIFKQSAHEHFCTLLQTCESHVVLLTVDVGNPAFVIVEKCMKAMLRLMVSGMDAVDEDDGVYAFMALVKSRRDVFLSGMGGPGVTAVQQRLSLTAAKVVARTFAKHPVSFGGFMPFFLEVYYEQLLQAKSSTDDSLAYAVSFQSARFLRSVAQCSAFDISREMIDAFATGNAVASNEKERLGIEVLTFFNPDRVQALVDVFLRHIFVLSPSELQTWLDDPETLLLEEGAAEWSDDSTRYECEELLKNLLIRDKERVAGMLLTTTERLSAQPGQEPLILDACYRAIGKCVYDIDKLVPFEKLFTERLAPVLAAPSTQDMNVRVLKARAAWLPGQFVGQLSREARPVVYSHLVPLLSMTLHDQVVALTAAKSMQLMVEDMGFFGTDFIPFLGACLSNIFSMSQQCESIETKRDLLGFAAGLFQRCPVSALLPLMADVAALLPILWEQAGAVVGAASPSTAQSGDNWSNRGGKPDGSENLYRTALVLVVTAIARKLGAASMQDAGLRQLALNIVAFGTSIGDRSGGSVYMLEEACELWGVVLDASTKYSADLSSLFPRVSLILRQDFDNLKIIYRVIEGYALLGGEAFWSEHGASTADLLAVTLRQVRDRGCLATCEVMDLLFQLHPSSAPAAFSGPMQRVLSSTIGGGESKTLGAAYVGLALRACVTNTPVVETELLNSSDQGVIDLVALGLKTVENMYLTKRRKLATLGIAALLVRHVARLQVLHSCIPEFLSAALGVLIEETHGGNNVRADFEHRVARYGEDGEGATANEQEEERMSAQLSADMPGNLRRNVLSTMEPAASMDLAVAVQEVLTVLKSTGMEVYESVLQPSGDILAKLDEVCRERQRNGGGSEGVSLHGLFDFLAC